MMRRDRAHKSAVRLAHHRGRVLMTSGGLALVLSVVFATGGRTVWEVAVLGTGVAGLLTLLAWTVACPRSRATRAAGTVATCHDWSTLVRSGTKSYSTQDSQS